MDMMYVRDNCNRMSYVTFTQEYTLQGLSYVNISNFMQNSYAAADSVSVHIGANVLCSVVTR